MVFENRVLRKTMGCRERGSKRGLEKIVLWGDLRDLHASPNAINVIKSRKIMWAGHVNVWGRGEMQTAL
jgi:hypothetical protein